MATQPTQNPVPSESPRDLKFNAGKIDEYVTSMGWTYTDRFGQKHYTIEGNNYLAQQAMAAFGYVVLNGKTFTTGATISQPNEVLLNTADGEYYKWTGSFASGPKVVPANSTPDTTGGIGPGAWVGVGDASLRAALAAPGGVDLVNGAAKQTDVDKLKKQNEAFAYIEDYSSMVVSGDWTAAINAAFATGKPVVGKGPYSVSGIINTKGQPIVSTFIISTTRYSLGAVTAQTVEPDSESIRMLYLESAYDLAELLYIKALGFNTINHYCYFANNGTIDASGTAEQLLDNARTAGLRVNLGTESPRATTSLSEFVNATKEHPATWGYSVYDEPASRGISVASQDAKITTLRGLTTKQLSFVDLISEGNPFNQLFSKSYDIAFVDSYSRVWTSGVALDNDLKKMRFDYGCIKAQTGLSRVIPVVSAFTDSGGYYASSESQVIAASKVFGAIFGGNFGAFVWDGVGDPNITGRVRSNINLQKLVAGLASQRTRKMLNTEAYLFGGAPGNTMWPITSLLEKIPVKDPSSSDAYSFANAFPVRVRTGTTESDRTTTIPNSDYSGIGFKGAFASLVTNIKFRKNVRCSLEYFNISGTTAGTFSLFGTNDAGYTISLKYNDAITGNSVLDFNVNSASFYDETIIFRVENNGDVSNYYRKFLRGLIVCSDW